MKKRFVSISLLNGSLFRFFFPFSVVDFFFLSDDFLFLGIDSSRLIINSLRHTNNQEGPGPFGLAGAEFVSSPATSKPRHLLHFQHSVTQTLTSVLPSYRQKMGQKMAECSSFRLKGRTTLLSPGPDIKYSGPVGAVY